MPSLCINLRKELLSNHNIAIRVTTDTQHDDDHDVKMKYYSRGARIRKLSALAQITVPRYACTFGFGTNSQSSDSSD